MSTSIAGHHTERPRRVERSVALAEAESFARDLGGTLAHVLVAAVGRALEREPALGWAVAGLGADPAVAVVAPRGGGRVLLAVPEARDAPLPALRRLVDALLAGVRPAGRVVEAGAPVVVAAVETAGAVPPTPAHDAEAAVRLVLAAPDALEGRLAVGLPGRPGADAADDLLDAVARLLERPYRRLL